VPNASLQYAPLLQGPELQVQQEEVALYEMGMGLWQSAFYPPFKARSCPIDNGKRQRLAVNSAKAH